MAYSLTSLAEYIYDVEFDFGELFRDKYADAAAARTGELPLISDWLEAHVGELNVLIYSSFNSVNKEIENFKQEEGSILLEMYMFNYYRKMGRLALRAKDTTMAGSVLDFKSLQEGDSVITMPEPSSGGGSSDLPKHYRLLMEQSRDNLEILVAQYNSLHSPPSQVSGDDGA
jgi:hypothetical protein|tara:strand:+ start:11176 stop:11691 length:516 start_codon:yes stop_codon:yes gene_type:complete